jgi:hypothetical protein
METGYVKFFDTRNGKLFGYLVDGMGNELWFHWADGRDPLLTVSGEVKLQLSPARLPYPKTGDPLVFERGKNTNGPKASPWGFKSVYDGLKNQWESKQPAKQIPQRHIAGLFDLRVTGPDDVHGSGPSSDAIGGFYGIGWWSYFKDATTGEVYGVHCTDGVNGGHGPYSHKDEVYRSSCYRVLLSRFRSASKNGASEIRISRNERVLMNGWTQARFLESAEGLHDGKDSQEGLEGGFVGHFHGLPVICDLTLQDNLPPRE